MAAFGRTSIGWFFGFKIHLVINHIGELMGFKVTRGNRHDGKAGVSLLSKLKGLAFGDKGYLGKKLFEKLIKNDLKLITRKRRGIKVDKLSHTERDLLNQRGIIETVIGHLKHYYHVWHTRHRSIINAIAHLVSAIAAYTIKPLTLAKIKLLTET